MTPEQIDIVRTTWARFAPNAEQVAILVYERLREIEPDSIKLAWHDAVAGGRVLMQLLQGVIDRLPDEPVASQKLDPESIGFERTHASSVGEALCWTIEQGLADDYTPAVAAAWLLAAAAFAGLLSRSVLNPAVRIAKPA